MLETYPRDELFQIDEDMLYQFAFAILQLDERPRVRVLPRRDRFDRFVSVLVYVPRDRYDSGVREAIGDYLATVYQGHVSAFYPFFPGRAAGARALHHRAARRRHAESRSRERWRTRSNAIIRTWTDGARRGAWRGASKPDARTRCRRAIATRSRERLPRSLSAGRSRSTTSG